MYCLLRAPHTVHKCIPLWLLSKKTKQEICHKKPRQDYFIQLTQKTRNGKKSGKNDTSKILYIKPRIELWKMSHNSYRPIRHIRLIHGHLMSINDQQPPCTNSACRNQTMTIKHFLGECSQWKDSIKNIISRAI